MIRVVIKEVSRQCNLGAFANGIRSGGNFNEDGVIDINRISFAHSRTTSVVEDLHRVEIRFISETGCGCQCIGCLTFKHTVGFVPLIVQVVEDSNRINVCVQGNVTRH